MSLVKALGHGSQRSLTAADAVAQTEAAVRSRPGFGGVWHNLDVKPSTACAQGSSNAMCTPCARHVARHGTSSRATVGSRSISW